MSRLYWDIPLLSPFLVTTMDHKQLKRSRSSESLDRAFKRSKPFQIDSPLSIASEPAPFTTTTPPPTASKDVNIYPIISPLSTHVQQQQSSFLKPISISTRTTQYGESEPSSSSSSSTPAAAFTLNSSRDYENINGILYSAHVERYGDPERRESWWQEQQRQKQDEDVEMEDDISNNEYDSVNSVLRQAFLQRHQQQH